jgi:eukaryotic-like serine/threonine-protein kinase
MPDLSGHHIERYHVIEKLGEGGMAIVYRAWDTRLERDVAIKVIRQEEVIPSNLERVRKRFEREARALAKLNHPNIVKVIDYGEYENSPYLVMEYVPGGSLEEHINGQYAADEAASLLLPVAQALAYAHAKDMVHRDVKPSNILVNESGELMLSDFGIARILESQGQTKLTGTSVGIGTPEYMAPEQGRDSCGSTDISHLATGYSRIG